MKPEDWTSLRWPVPVRTGAGNPRVFRLPLRLDWVPQSQQLIDRLSARRLRLSWPKKMRKNFMHVAKTKIIPTAIRRLRMQYRWRGRVGRSLEAWASARPGEAKLTVGTDLRAERPLFGKWAGGYVFPVGLHEGIKRHWVWVKAPGIDRPLFREWVREHLGAQAVEKMQKERWFGLRVFKRGRRRTATHFLSAAVQFEHRLDLEHSISDAIDDAIVAGISRWVT